MNNNSCDDSESEAEEDLQTETSRKTLPAATHQDKVSFFLHNTPYSFPQKQIIFLYLPSLAFQISKNNNSGVASKAKEVTAERSDSRKMATQDKRQRGPFPYVIYMWEDDRGVKRTHIWVWGPSGA